MFHSFNDKDLFLILKPDCYSLTCVDMEYSQHEFVLNAHSDLKVNHLQLKPLSTVVLCIDQQ